jgi:hypothetical protein
VQLKKTGQTISTAFGHSNLDYHGEKIDALHDQNNLCRDTNQVISNETLVKFTKQQCVLFAYLGPIRLRISSGLFRVSAARTTVISRPENIWRFMWYCASEAS